MFGGFHDGMGAGGWVLMSLFWIVLVAVTVWAIARIIPARGEQPREPMRSSDEPLAILDRRLARGEIDGEAYEQLREKLTTRPAAGTG